MLDVNHFSIQSEVPEIVYNIKSPSICKLCKPHQRVRDCISHVLDNHLQDILQSTILREMIQTRGCCITEYEKTNPKAFLFHFAKKHGPVGFKTGGNFCFLVTCTPILEPTFRNGHFEQLEQLMDRTLIFQTVPFDSFDNEIHSRELKIFVRHHIKVLDEQLGSLMQKGAAMHDAEIDFVEGKMKENIQKGSNGNNYTNIVSESGFTEYQNLVQRLKLSRALKQSQLLNCKDKLDQCIHIWNQFSKHGLDRKHKQKEKMKEIEETTNSILNYVKHQTVIDKRIEDGKFTTVKKEEGGISHVFVKIETFHDQELELNFKINNRIHLDVKLQ